MLTSSVLLVREAMFVTKYPRESRPPGEVSGHIGTIWRTIMLPASRLLESGLARRLEEER